MCTRIGFEVQGARVQWSSVPQQGCRLARVCCIRDGMRYYMLSLRPWQLARHQACTHFVANLIPKHFRCPDLCSFHVERVKKLCAQKGHPRQGSPCSCQQLCRATMQWMLQRTVHMDLGACFMSSSCNEDKPLSLSGTSKLSTRRGGTLSTA